MLGSSREPPAFTFFSCTCVGRNSAGSHEANQSGSPPEAAPSARLAIGYRLWNELRASSAQRP